MNYINIVTSWVGVFHKYTPAIFTRTSQVSGVGFLMLIYILFFCVFKNIFTCYDFSLLQAVITITNTRTPFAN